MAVSLPRSGTSSSRSSPTSASPGGSAPIASTRKSSPVSTASQSCRHSVRQRSFSRRSHVTDNWMLVRCSMRWPKSRERQIGEGRRCSLSPPRTSWCALTRPRLNPRLNPVAPPTRLQIGSRVSSPQAVRSPSESTLGRGRSLRLDPCITAGQLCFCGRSTATEDTPCACDEPTPGSRARWLLGLGVRGSRDGRAILGRRPGPSRLRQWRGSTSAVSFWRSPAPRHCAARLGTRLRWLRHWGDTRPSRCGGVASTISQTGHGRPGP